MPTRWGYGQNYRAARKEVSKRSEFVCDDWRWLVLMDCAWNPQCRYLWPGHKAGRPSRFGLREQSHPSVLFEQVMAYQGSSGWLVFFFLLSLTLYSLLSGISTLQVGRKNETRLLPNVIRTRTIIVTMWMQRKLATVSRAWRAHWWWVELFSLEIRVWYKTLSEAQIWCHGHVILPHPR